MAHIYKLPSGKWRAQLEITGFPRESATHSTKAKAQAWAVDRERILRLHGADSGHTLYDLLNRYADTESPKHRGERWERLFIASMMREGSPLPDVLLRNMTTAHLAAWRDERLQQVTSGTVAREYHVIRAALNVARKEWKWLHVDVADGFKPPPPNRARDRILNDGEVTAIIDALGGLVLPPVTLKHEIAIAFAVALETGMRKGEILGLQPGDIVGSVARLRMTKNGEAREVPLSKRARELLAHLPFRVSTSTADAMFRDAVRRSGVIDVHFHDSRHTAATRLARKLQLLELCRMFGWKNPKQVMVYYNKPASQIAELLD